jgi:uncharacterized HhH-GPD family protein
MEWAFAGPTTLRSRLGQIDATRIAAMPEEELVAVCCEKPAIHRFPAVMGRRIHALCAALASRFGGRGEGVWTGVADGDELLERLRSLPGFGDEKARIFVAVLGKRLGVRPPGWVEAAGVFGDAVPRSIADIDSPESLARVKAWKKAQRAAGKDKQDRALPPQADVRASQGADR